jgi:hypothetical protein
VGDGGYGVCGGGGGRDLGEGKTDDEIGSEFSARLSCAIKVELGGKPVGCHHFPRKTTALQQNRLTTGAVMCYVSYQHHF